MPDNPGPCASILLLDSDPVTRAVLCEVLEHAGHLIVSVGDLGSAVDRLRRMRPDLLIVRPYINSMTGQMAAQHLRVDSPGLPVLIVDGFIEDERIQVQSAVHNMHVFPKPFAPADFVDEVKRVLRRVRENSQVKAAKPHAGPG